MCYNENGDEIMKRFQITEAEYEAIKAKEAKTKDKNISRRLRVLMLRYE